MCTFILRPDTLTLEMNFPQRNQKYDCIVIIMYSCMLKHGLK